jgi:zinc/manganese transport system substrate-binding protein
MKIYKVKTFAAACLVLLIWVPYSWAGLKVVTTTSDLASIAKEVGGSLVQVDSLIKGYQDPHFIQPKPSYMVKVNRADLLIYQGLELEIAWLPVLIKGARNPAIMLGQPGHLNASLGISPLEIPRGEIDRAMGDIHPFGNPHYHLDPENGFIIAQAIFKKLSQLDPDNTGLYKTNLEQFNKKLEGKIAQWKTRMAPFKNMKIVSYHKLWGYFATRFELRVVDRIEVKPGVPPTTKHLARLISMMKRENIKLILQATYYKSEFSNRVANEIEGTVLSLPVFVGGTAEATDYFSLFDTIIKRLTQVLK